MQIFIVNCDDSLYKDARKYFLKLGRSDFLNKSKESLCGRFIVSQKMQSLWYSNFVPEDAPYVCDKRFYSISHSDNKIFLAISQKKIAVDLEKIVKRDNSLLKNTSKILDLSLWESFYLQRTAKECLIKYLDLTQSEMNEMIFVFSEHIKVSYFWWISFKTKFSFRKKSFDVFSSFEWNYIFSLIA